MRLVIVGGIAGVGFSQMRDDTEQFPHSHQVPGARCVGEQAVVTDAVEAVRQDMDEEAADELRCRQGHDLVAGLPLSLSI